ncbi:GNAT family N-acetyltransferase [Clostridium rectalis]|uniref:GNAT family N-acetyltransferase n=1 Tax=Clostridium rectalis TaxID=2040295 RepID=UPI000F63A584|nr:GNAT family protein [Clostridium rectalis]
MFINNLLSSDILKITAFREEDVDVVTKWYEDYKFLRFFDYNPAAPLHKEKVRQWLLQEINNENNFFFVIRDKNEEEMIGYIEIEEINWSNGVGTIAMGIGNNLNRGKGYGKEALSLVMEFAFMELNLHRLQLITISYNTIAIKLYESLGFKKEGVLREAVKRDGFRYDIYQYGILLNEWNKVRDKKDR